MLAVSVFDGLGLAWRVAVHCLSGVALATESMSGGAGDLAGLAGLPEDVAALALALRDGVPSEDVVASVRDLNALDAKPMNCGIRCNPADHACCKSSNVC